MYNIELIPLIKDFQNGKHEQFDILYKAFEKLLIHYANQLKDDDLLQELSGFRWTSLTWTPPLTFKNILLFL